MYEQFGKDVRLMAVNCWMFEVETYCLFAVVVGGGVGSVGHVLGLDRGAGGLGDLVVHGSASHLGHSVAVLNLHGDGLDDRVVNAVLGDDLTASVLDGGGQLGADGVGDGQVGDGGLDMVGDGDGGGVGDQGSGGVVESVVGIAVESIGIGVGLSLGISLTLVDGVVALGDWGVDGGVAENVGELLAEGHVLDLLGVDGDGVADVLGGGHAVLGGQHLVDGLAVGGGVVGNGSHWSGGQGSGGKELRVSLSVSSGGSASEGNKTGDGKYLRERS